ncbi:MAG: hypothetical protein ACE5R6_13150 [Candidatus Heimdallarchaeota archaeon]
MDELPQKEKISMGLAGVVVISCFLPWATVTSIFGLMSVSSCLQGERFLIDAIMSLFFVGLMLGGHKARKNLTLIASFVCLGIFAIDFMQIDELTREITVECVGFC